MSNFMKIHPVEPKVIPCRGTNRQTGRYKKLVVAFCDFVNAPGNSRKESALPSKRRYVRLSSELHENKVLAL